MEEPFRQHIAVVALFLMLLIPVRGHAESNMVGQAGLINMPDATLEADGTFRFGTSYFRPYQPWWFSFTLLPILEFSGRYTTFHGLEGFEDNPDFGDYKDKSFDLKLQLLQESDWLPDLSVGWLDFTGTKLLTAKYGVLTKQFGPAELTLGYGSDRIDGLFGGIRLRNPWNEHVSFIAEYDATDYANDYRAVESGAAERAAGWTYGVAYQGDWFGVQLAKQDDEIGAMAYVSVPLMDREFIPKIHEPAPFTEAVPKVRINQWLADTTYAAKIGEALHKDGYKNVLLGYNGHTLEATLSNVRISMTGRSVGRAARVLLAHRPLETERIRITYKSNDLPLMTYHFKNVHKLERYFDGLLSRQQLENYIDVDYAQPVQVKSFELNAIDLAAVPAGKDASLNTEYGKDGHMLTLSHEDNRLNRFRITPFNLSGFFNDPSGAFRYDIFATANYKRQLDKGLFLEAAARLTLFEDVSDITQESNSLLPHVRTDIAKYKRGRALKLDRLLVNKLVNPRERVYGRLSAGYYEEMYGGVGGQLLYLPKKGNWALDLSVDWLKQRGYDGDLEFRDYSTVTALAAVHYRIPRYGLTLTARGGRFLARDNGVRIEVKRRFRSGIEFGGWYTVTDGDDITSPGSPDNPYHDKGIFLSIPLNSLLTKDTRSTAAFLLPPWTRDVGQMVMSPLDLYNTVERPLNFGHYEADLMTDFGQ